LASIFHANWTSATFLTIGLVLTYGARSFATWLAIKIDRTEEETNAEPLTASGAAYMIGVLIFGVLVLVIYKPSNFSQTMPTGAGADRPAGAQRYEEAIGPELPPDTRRPLSIAAAKEKFGDDAALGVLQGYRQANQGFMGKAAGALAHNDLTMAARLASRAASFVPSGYHLSFDPNGDSGVVANLADAGGNVTKTPLTVSQFNEYLHGPAGQFDHVLENGEGQSIKMLEKSPGVPLGTPGAGAPARGTPGGGGPQQGQTTAGRSAPAGR
jgi:hypothetical protein